MCGRYTFFTDQELKEVDDIIEKIDNDIKRDALFHQPDFMNGIKKKINI